MLPLRARVDLGAMATKGYSAFSKDPASLKPHHQIVYCHIQDTHWRGGVSYFSAVVQSVYSIAPSDWENRAMVNKLSYLVKLTTIDEGDLKAPFSIITTPRCREGRYSFPWIVPLYPWSLPYNAVLHKEASSTIFWVFGMTRPRIEPRSPGPLANTNR